MSKELIKINDQALRLKNYKGVPVVTFGDIDEVHQRPEGTAKRNFSRNHDRFIAGVDFIKVCADEFRRLIGSNDSRYKTDITLITESGYLMLCKSFTDDLSWTVQRELVNSYFRHNQLVSPMPYYKYKQKTLNGIPVATLEDIANVYSIPQYKAKQFLETHCTMPDDYTKLKGRDDIYMFSKENDAVIDYKNVVNLILIYPSGLRNLLRYFGFPYEDMKFFAPAALQYELEQAKRIEELKNNHQEQAPDPSDVLNENEARLIEGIRNATPEERLATKRFLIAYLKCIVEQEEKENEAIKRLYCNDRP